MARAGGGLPVTSQAHTTPVAGTARAFLAMLCRSLGWQLAASAAIAVALALAEGTGLVLLVPLLGSIGLTVEQGPTSRLAAWVEQGFTAAGLEPTLAVVLLVFLAVSAAHAVLYRAHLLLNPSLEQQFSTALRTRLYAAILSARWSFLVRRRVPDLVHAVTSHVDRSSSAAYQLLTLLTGLAVSGVYVAIALRLSFTLTMLVAVAGVAILWTLRGRTERSAQSGERYADADRSLFRMTAESVAGVKIAKSLGAEARDVAIFGGLARHRATAYLAVLRSFAQAKMRLDIVSALMICVLLYVAVEWLALRGAGLLVLIFVFARIMPRAMALQESMQMFVTGLPAFAAVMALVDECAAEAEPADDGTTRRLEMRREVRVEGVSYRYTSDAPVLRDVSLTIPAGLTTAIAGASGAGKSTLADLLLGLLSPDTGAISIDGALLSASDARTWRRSVGYVPQDVFLLHDTIRANLLWARPDASEADMWEALDWAAAAGFVRERPEGLDAVIGDRGTRLSGGERQRLALARALLTRPDLLILDEATSALDSVNEQQILRAVRSLKHRVTTIIITHRLTAIRDVDVIHVFELGAHVESGTWSELSGRGGVFTRLWEAQQIETMPESQRPASEIPPATSGRATATHGQ